MPPLQDEGLDLAYRFASWMYRADSNLFWAQVRGEHLRSILHPAGLARIEITSAWQNYLPDQGATRRACIVASQLELDTKLEGTR